MSEPELDRYERGRALVEVSGAEQSFAIWHGLAQTWAGACSTIQ